MPEKKDALKFIALFGLLYVVTKHTPINGWLLSLFNDSVTVLVIIIFGSLILTFGFEVARQFFKFFN
jgi:uncharacterized membrane protein YdbT with pleckstrin-like domain